MKRLFFIAAPVLGAALILFFVNVTPRASFAIGIIGVTNRVTAGFAVTVAVTNMTYQDLRFEAMILTPSNGVWAAPHADYTGFGPEGFLAAREHTSFLVQTHETPEVVRFRIHFWRDDRRRKRWLETLWQKLGRTRAPPDWRGEVYISEPFHLPPP